MTALRTNGKPSSLIQK